ncbi:hypothetical protein JKY79_00075 [Candidatus Babeliales bacterium]|nr:hypothetical protein [Candidatus Babeliales bacterium]
MQISSPHQKLETKYSLDSTLLNREKSGFAGSDRKVLKQDQDESKKSIRQGIADEKKRMKLLNKKPSRFKRRSIRH